MSEAFTAEIVQTLAQVEPDSFWFHNRNLLLAQTIRRRFPDARSLLEVGCGTGYVLTGLRQAFPRMRLAGVDLSPEAIRVARNRLPDVGLQVGDGRDISGGYDLVCAFDMLEHVPDDETVMRLMASCARLGVVVTVPQHPWLYSDFDRLCGHHRRYTRAELAGKLRAAGAEDVRTTSFVTLLLPAMLLSRRGSGERAAAALRLPGPLDRAARLALLAERGMIRAGIRLPVGGSLLATAATR